MSVQKAYNEWADHYDSMDNKTRDLERTAKQKTIGAIDFKIVLELGCGTGKNTEWIADKAEKVIAVDFSEEMMEKAKQKIKSGNVQFIQADINKPWGFLTAQPDLITCSLILEHIENLDFIFSEASTILAQNGYFYICELHPFKQYAGSKARFEKNNELHVLDCYTHHFSDYLNVSKDNGFELKLINEWFDNDDRTEIPRLISFLFKKN